jgi:hypothetical protein
MFKTVNCSCRKVKPVVLKFQVIEFKAAFVVLTLTFT